MRLIFVFISLILSFYSIAQSKKKHIYQLNQEVTSLKYKVNKLEITQSKYADSMKMMHAKYSEDIKVLMLQIDLLNNKKNKTRLENEKKIFIKDSICFFLFCPKATLDKNTKTNINLIILFLNKPP